MILNRSHKDKKSKRLQKESEEDDKIVIIGLLLESNQPLIYSRCIVKLLFDTRKLAYESCVSRLK